MSFRIPILCLAAALLGACAAPRPLAPPPPPQIAAPPPRPVQTAQNLVQRCRAVAPRAHPWRAQQIHSAILQYDLSRSYRRSAALMKPLDRERAQTQEREAWGILWETCQPVLAGPVTASGG